MEKRKYSSESIERYFDGLLSEDELKDFEMTLNDDENLRSEVDLYKSIDDVFMETDIMNLRSTLEEIHTKNSRERMGKVFAGPYIRKIAIAASFLLIVGASVIIYQSRLNSPENVFAKYYEPYEVHGIVRSVNTVQDEILILALQRYQEQNYHDAARLFQQVLKKDKDNVQVHLYSGISNMEIEELQRANESFNVILEDNDNLYVEHAEWYLGLCYLKLNEIEIALDYFKRIASSESYYKDKASEIVRKLS